MEQHPIPKNVLTVEFKLFGSLSVRQFLRVLFGSLIALALFFLPLHPILKYPLMLASVLIGVGSALLPGFDSKFTAISKSLFVSPRYVWRKEVQVPDVLKATPKATDDKKKKPKSNNIDDMTIDQVLSARAQVLPLVTADKSVLPTPAIQRAMVTAPAPSAQAVANPQPPARRIEEEADHFAQMYHEVFGVKTLDDSLQARGASAQPVIQQSGLAGQSGGGTTVAIGQNMQAVVKPLNNTAARPASNAIIPPKSNYEANTPNLLASYREELTMLQSQLQQLNKSGGDEDKKKQIMQRIDEIYKSIQSSSNTEDKASAQVRRFPAGKTLDAPAEAESQIIYGLVVDKKEQPLQEAKISIHDGAGKPLIDNIVTRADGTFAIDAPLSHGEYMVKITHPKYKFHDFKIVIADAKLPGYKFRPR